jgi:hypothetical protein
MSTSNIDPASFYNEIFKDFLPICENNVIEYKIFPAKKVPINNYKIDFKNDPDYDIILKYDIVNIITFNGHADIISFKSEIQHSLNNSFLLLRSKIKEIDTYNQFVFLEYIKDQLVILKNRVDEKFAYRINPNLYMNLKDGKHFLGFVNVETKGSLKKINSRVQDLIECEAAHYPKCWIQHIDESIIKVNELIETCKLFSGTSGKKQVPQIKIKTDLSVPELAYLFRVLKEEKLINIASGKAEEFFRAVSDSFSSKMQPEISPKSFKTDFYSPDPNIINFWHQKFIHFAQRAKKDLG